MSEELSVEDHNDFTMLVQNLMAHLGNTRVLAEVNQYKNDDKVMLPKEEHKKRMEEVCDHLFKDTDLPEDFPNVKTVNDDIKELKKFISGHEQKEYMLDEFKSLLEEGNGEWLNSNAENANGEMGGGRRKKRSRTRAGKKTYRKKRSATKKSASRRRRHK